MKEKKIPENKLDEKMDHSYVCNTQLFNEELKNAAEIAEKEDGCKEC